MELRVNTRLVLRCPKAKQVGFENLEKKGGMVADPLTPPCPRYDHDCFVFFNPVP